MISDAYASWSSSSLDTAPDLTVVVALDAGDEIVPSIEALAAHVAVRELTWELIVVATAPDVNAPWTDEPANAFFIRGRSGDERWASVRRAFEVASGDLVLLTDADTTNAVVELDRILDRLADGADAVVGWAADGVVDDVHDLPDLPAVVCCQRMVARSFSDAQAVFGGTSFADTLRITDFWGLRVDELQVGIAADGQAAGTALGHGPRWVCGGPHASPVLLG